MVFPFDNHKNECVLLWNFYVIAFIFFATWKAGRKVLFSIFYACWLTPYKLVEGIISIQGIHVSS